MTNAVNCEAVTSTLDRPRDAINKQGLAVELSGQGVYRNGLWHRDLSYGRDHVETNNWRMAVYRLVAQD